MKKIIKYSIYFLIFICLFIINSINTFALNISIDNIDVIEKSNSIELESTEYNQNNIISGITFNELNDFVTYEITLLNNEKTNYTIESITDNNNSEYITTEYSFDDSKLESKKTKKIIVKLKYNNRLVNSDDINIDDYKITLNLVNDKGVKDSTEINPKTSDSIIFYLMLTIISLLALMFFTLLLKRRKSKMYILLLVIIPVVMGAKKVLNIDIIFTNIKIHATNLPYNVTIKDENDNITTRTIIYGNKVGELPNVSKTGYNFIKYVDQDNNEVTGDTIVRGNMEIKPVFDVIEYNITYVNDGEPVENKTKYTVEDTFDLVNPTKEGYSFSGWTGDSLDGMQTRVTITNSTGDLNFKANFSPNEDTIYTVNHKYPKLNGGYDIDTEELRGTTDSYVTPAHKEKHGFTGPDLQRVQIKPNGSTVVDYVYTRDDYTFNITDRTYVTNSTEDGSYPFETEIEVHASERAGYDFSWSDGNTDYDRTISLSDNLSLSTIYTPHNDTKYTVIHKLRDLNSDTYTTKETMVYYDTTDKVVTPPTNEYQGFVSPEEKSLKILGDGTATLEYLYEREEYTIKFNSNGGSDVSNKVLTYGEKLGTLDVPEYPNNDFIGWFTLETGGEPVDENFVPTDDMTLYAHWNYNPFPIVFSKQGACTFNGSEGNITGEDCSEYYGVDHIDTNIALYSTDNYNKDYEIGFYIDSVGLNQLFQATLMNTKNELGTKVSSGIVCRFFDSSDQFEISQFINSVRARDLYNFNGISKVVIVRKNGDYYYSIDDGFYKLLQKNIEPPDTHNITTWFGSSRGSDGLSTRQFKGTLSNMYIRLGSYTSDDFTITFEPNGGTVDENSRVRKGVEPLGDLPMPTKNDSKFIGWYTKPAGGIKVEKNDLVSKDITLYAHWVSLGSSVEVNGSSYTDLNNALNSITSDEGEVTITLLEDIETSSKIDKNKNIVINTNGHTITNANNSYIFEVSGKLTITNGNILTSASNAAAINVTSTGELNLNGGNIEVTGAKQAIYNNGGKVVLDGGVKLSNDSTNRATVQVLENGLLDIKDATIISNYYNALRIDKGIVNIGVNDDIIDTTPVLQGKKYAISTAVNVNMYDGILKGYTDVVDNISKLKINSTNETVTDTEIIGKVEYKTLYLKNK